MTEPAWLERLNQATSFAELHDVFGEIVQFIQENPRRKELDSHLQKAIKKFEGERQRDENSLNEVKSRLAEFLKANSGVVGFFKRNISLTEEGKKRAELRKEEDRRLLELHIDDLLILRLHILGELVLPSDKRSYGDRLEEWVTRIYRERSALKLDALVQHLLSLRAESSSSEKKNDEYKERINTLSKEIRKRMEEEARVRGELKKAQEALAALNFPDKVPISPTEIIRVANEEIGHLSKEIETEKNFFEMTVKELPELVRSEQLQAEGRFSDLHKRQVRYQGVVQGDLIRTSVAAVEKLYKASQTVWNFAQERAQHPVEIATIKNRLDELRRRHESACQVTTAKAKTLDEKKVVYLKAKPAFDEHKSRFQTTQAQFDSAQSNLQQSKSQQEQARANVTITKQNDEEARRNVTQAQENLKTAKSQLAGLEQQLELLRRQVQSEQNQFPDFPPESVNQGKSNAQLQLENLSRQLEQTRPRVGAAEAAVKAASEKAVTAKQAAEKAPALLEASNKNLQQAAETFTKVEKSYLQDKSKFVEEERKFNGIQAEFQQAQNEYDHALRVQRNLEQSIHDNRERQQYLEKRLQSLETLFPQAIETACRLISNGKMAMQGLLGALPDFKMLPKEREAFVGQTSEVLAGKVGLPAGLADSVRRIEQNSPEYKNDMRAVEELWRWLLELPSGIGEEFKLLQKEKIAIWRGRCQHLLNKLGKDFFEKYCSSEQEPEIPKSDMSNKDFEKYLKKLTSELKKVELA